MNKKQTGIILLFIMALFLLWVVVYADTTANLTWDDPTTNVDGTPLTDLAGLRVYRNDSIIASVLPGAEAYADLGLPNGTYCYHVTAFDESANESDPSNIACKTIDALFPSSPSNLSIS